MLIPAPDHPQPNTLPLDQLLDGPGSVGYERAMCGVVATVADRFAHCNGPCSGITHTELGAQLAAVDLDRPLGDTASAVRELETLYLRDAVYFHHPRYLAHLNCPVLVPAVAADAIASAVNSSLDTWDQSVGGTLIEQRLIAWSCDRVGFDPEAADGIFTSGGTQSNLHALYLAREQALTAGDRPRTETLPLLRILTSTDSHFSVTTAARLLGLHPDAVLAVPTDERRRMDPAALRQALGELGEQGLVPMAVVATAGTTDFGVIDPLPAVAQVVEAQPDPLWLHVDAAYGGGLLVSPTRRGLLDGLERAHSVTVDFHKSFFQPVSASVVLVRRRHWMDPGRHHADYLNPIAMTRAGIPNQVDKSLQTTRRFDALKLWVTLRVLGADGVGALFDRVIDLATEAYARIAADDRFEVVAPSDLSTVVFRWVPGTGAEPDPELVAAANLAARRELARNGEAMIASTTVDGHTFLKFTLLNPRTSAADIAAVLELIADHAATVHSAARPSLAS